MVYNSDNVLFLIFYVYPMIGTLIMTVLMFLDANELVGRKKELVRFIAMCVVCCIPVVNILNLFRLMWILECKSYEN